MTLDNEERYVSKIHHWVGKAHCISSEIVNNDLHLWSVSSVLIPTDGIHGKSLVLKEALGFSLPNEMTTEKGAALACRHKRTENF